MRRSRHASILPIVLAAALPLLAGPARAGVDAEVPLKAKSRGTILPEGEVETYRFDATAGTALTLAVSPDRGADLALTATLEDPDGDPVGLGGALADGKVRVKGLLLALTGTYTLRVSAEGTGGYALSLTGKPAKKDGGTLALPGSGTVPFAFSAPRGSAAALSVKAARGSAAVPRFGLLTGDSYGVDLSGLGKVGASSHSVKVAPLGSAGDLSVEVVNGSAAAGDAEVKVTVRPPKVKMLKLDVRGGALGHAAGGETLLARTVDETGGTVAVADPESDLDGTAVDVPPGAFDGPTLVTIRSSPPVIAGSDDEKQASGPSVELGPPGTVFSEAVTVTLPYDLASVPFGSSPQDLKVLVVEDDGSTLVVNPSGVDETGGTVTVQTTTFSICIPFSLPGIARIGLDPGGDQYWALVLDFEMQQGVGNDSRYRQFDLQVGELALLGDGTFQASLEDRWISFTDASSASTYQSTGTPDYPSGTWVYGADGQSVELVTAEPDSPKPRVTRDAKYMVGGGTTGSAMDVALQLFLRKPASPPAVAALAGTYHVLTEELEFNPGNPGSSLEPELSRESGSLTFDGSGRFQGSVSGKTARFNPNTGTHVLEPDGGTGAGAYAVDPDGTVILTFDPEDPGDQGDVLRLFPGRDLDVMFGADRDPCGSCVFVIFLVRQSTAFDASALAGTHLGRAIDLEPGGFGAGPVNAPDYGLRDEVLTLDLDPGGGLAVQIGEHVVTRDTGVAGGVRVENGLDSVIGNWSVNRKGKLAISVPGETGEPMGAVAPTGDFGVLLTNTAANEGTTLLGFFLRPPPPNN